VGRLPAAFILLLALVLVITGALIGGLWKDVGMGVAGSLIAAVVFAFIYQSQLEQFVIGQTKSIIASAVEEGSKSIDATVQRILMAHTAEIGKRLQHHLPSRFWPASDSQHDQFVTLVNEHIGRSSSYKYKGDRALFLCCRLQDLFDRNALPNNLRMEVILTDPREQRCLEATTRYRTARAGQAGGQLTQLTEELRKDIFCSLYGLYKLRGCCDITIVLAREIPLFRVEIADGALFLSIMPSLHGGRYPDTAFYDQMSDYFLWLKKYFDTLFTSAAPADSIRLSTLRTDAELLQLLQGLGCTDTLDDLEKRLVKYRKGR
jgi:hypothetical protein